MRYNCDICDDGFESKQMLKTHLLLKHRSQIENPEDYISTVSEGHLSGEVRAEKGEQFGYR